MVSHNQQFLSQCAKEMWTVENGRVKVDVVDNNEVGTTFDDLYGKYKEYLRKEVQQQQRGKKIKNKGPGSPSPPKRK